MHAKKSRGQATVEYIFILAFAIFLGLKVTDKFTGFFRDSMGTVGHTLSTNLIVGVCERDCFFAGYYNTFKGSQ